MNARIAKISERLRSNLWILPVLITVVVSIVALLLVELDRQTASAGVRMLPWTFQGGAESARAVLSTIAGSMITVAGTTYSIVIVALVLASTQFAPRVLRSFMRDRNNQVILGFFIATFTYCLLVLRSIRGLEDAQFVPGTAVTGGVVLALISLGMLIYFIDRISHNIQASSIIVTISNETVKQINHLYPDEWSDTNGTYAARRSVNYDWGPIYSDTSGYLEYVDYDELFGITRRADITLRIERVVGDFIIVGTPIAFIAPADQFTPALATRINNAVALGRNRTMQQDIAFGIRQIVDIALKALSPGINDPTTAVNCIDYLGVILTTLTNRHFPSLDRLDEAGEVCILARELTFQDFVDLAFDQIRHFGAKDPVIIARLLDTITQMAAVTRSSAHREVLREHVDRLTVAIEHAMPEYEIEMMQERLHGARRAVQMLVITERDLVGTAGPGPAHQV